MGENLIGPGKGNELGHFEDREFVNFHMALLKDNSSNMFSPKKALTITLERRTEGHDLFNTKKKKIKAWGWKDPRTSLFLDFWADIDPAIRFILLYRDPSSVIDSLLRRGTDRRLTFMPWSAAAAWIRYNQEILDFFYTHKTRSILINISGFNKDPKINSSFLEDFLETKMAIGYSDVFCPGNISDSGKITNKMRTGLVTAGFSKKFEAIYSSLERNAAISGN